MQASRRSLDALPTLHGSSWPQPWIQAAMKTSRRLLYLERKRLDDASYNQSEPRLSAVRPLMYIARATLDNAQLIAWQIKNTPR